MKVTKVMKDKVIKFVKKKYLNDSFPLEVRIYMIIFFELLFVSILSATTNTLLGKGILGVSLQWTVIIFSIITLATPGDFRIKIHKPIVIFISFIYLPFLFFQTAGYEGTAMLFAPLSIFLLAIIFKRKRRILLVVLAVLVYSACCIAQYYNPGLVVPHATEIDKLIDLLVALVLATTSISIIAVYVINAYEVEEAKIRQFADEDALTGIYNRRKLYEFLTIELEYAKREEVPLSVIMFDLDNFKKINDTYGHSVGDMVLQHTASVVLGQLRSHDFFARYGGEEFFVVFRNTKTENALLVAERIRTKVESHQYDDGVRATISIGLAVSDKEDSVESLVQRVDEYLYRAKEEGKNRIVGQL